MKKLIEKKLAELELGELEGPATEVITKLKDKLGHFPEFQNFIFKVTYAWNDAYEHDKLILLGKRLETDAEYECRLQRSRTAKEATKRRLETAHQRELENFNKLKEKLQKRGII